MDERVPLIIVNIFNIDHVENVNAPRSEFEEQSAAILQEQVIRHS